LFRCLKIKSQVGETGKEIRSKVIERHQLFMLSQGVFFQNSKPKYLAMLVTQSGLSHSSCFVPGL